MRFICDENTDAKRFVANCNESVEDCLWRYPVVLRGVGDDEMLPVIMAGDRSLITNDALMAETHANVIPLENPGMIVVRLRRPTRTMTIALTQSLIARFKGLFPQWSTFDWRNTHLEVCEDAVIVCKLPLKGEKRVIAYDDAFSDKLVGAISEIRSSFLPGNEHFDR